MTPEQIRDLPDWAQRKGLFKLAGISSDNIRMRVGKLPTEEEAEAITRAMVPLIHVEDVMPLLEAAYGVIDAWEAGYDYNAIKRAVDGLRLQFETIREECGL